jgi:predicted TIM-barrel fold metal-dependent hydrolase
LRIDIHAHVFPDNYLEFLQRSGHTSISGIATAHRFRGSTSLPDLETRFRSMKDAGIDKEAISAAGLVPSFSNEGVSVEAAHLLNDTYCKLKREYPDRFVAFGSLPLPHIDSSLKEISRCLDELEMSGIAVTTTILGKSIADSSFEPIFNELNKRGALLFVHPANICAGSRYIEENGLNIVIGQPFEDTICVLLLLKFGVIKRYPDVRFVICHLGGTIPFLIKRIDGKSPAFMPQSSVKPSSLLRSLWYCSANSFGPSLKSAVEVYGSDRILLGTDYPYWEGEYHKLAVEYIEQSGLSERDIAKILDENAAKLLRL